MKTTLVRLATFLFLMSVTTGFASGGEGRVAFSIMNNDDAPATVETALKLLKSLRHE